MMRSATPIHKGADRLASLQETEGSQATVLPEHVAASKRATPFALHDFTGARRRSLPSIDYGFALRTDGAPGAFGVLVEGASVTQRISPPQPTMNSPARDAFTFISTNGLLIG